MKGAEDEKEGNIYIILYIRYNIRNIKMVPTIRRKPPPPPPLQLSRRWLPQVRLIYVWELFFAS